MSAAGRGYSVTTEAIDRALARHGAGPGTPSAGVAYTGSTLAPSPSPSPAAHSSGPGTTSTVLVSVVVSAAVTLVVGGLTQAELARRERNTRRYERIRAGLYDVEEASAVHRTKVRAYGALVRSLNGARTPALAAAELAFDESKQRLETTISRTGSVVSDAVKEWMGAANLRFVSTNDVSNDAEQHLWDRMLRIIGAAMNDPNATVRTINEIDKRDAEKQKRQGRGTAGG